MIILYLFEDTYGIADIFKCCNNLGCCSEPRVLYKINETAYFIVGLGQRDAVSVSSRFCIEAINNCKADIVISIFDMDNLSGDNAKVLTLAEFDKAVESTCKNVEHFYIPVTYAAETIILYQFFKEVNGGSLLKLVHISNTKKLHLELLKECLYEDARTKKVNVKRVHEYLDVARLCKNIEDSSNLYDINREVKRWILESMSISSKVGLNLEEVRSVIIEVNKLFQWYLASPNNVIIGGKYTIDLFDKNFTKPIIKQIK